MSTTTSNLAILGAGPTGLEAALAAEEAGLPFTVFEASGGPAGAVAEWGHVRLFTPWDLSVSPRARRRLEAAGHDVPAGDTCPLARELLDHVYRPLAELPGIAGRLRLEHRAVAVGRAGLLKNEQIGTGRRSEHPFRILLDTPDGQRIESAGLVIDCTGTWGQPNALGDGGIPAPGEREAADRIVRFLPDLETDADDWIGRRTLLVGAGHSGQTAARALAKLADANGSTHTIWAFRSENPRFEIPHDPLPQRAALTREAGALAAGTSPGLEPITGVVVDRIDDAPSGLQVTLRHADGARRVVEVDRILSLTGSVGDHTIYRQLQVHECWATSGPMKLAATLLGASGGDCLDQTSHGADTLKNPEPGFFILGSKSYGRNTTFLLRVGWQQVDEVFELLAGA